jgi:murein DD-endopeptidase MepM/ murein hydrolase activator NlpD
LAKVASGGAFLANTHPFRRGKSGSAELQQRRPLVQWRQAGLLALLCSGVALAALPRASQAATDEDNQWKALSIAPLSSGGRTGMRMIASQKVEPIDFAPARPTVERAMVFGRGDSIEALLNRAGVPYPDSATAAAMISGAATAIPAGTTVSVVLGRKDGLDRRLQRIRLRANLGLMVEVVRDGEGLRLLRQPIAVDARPLRVRGRVGDGLYWSLRAAGVSPQSAAEYLAALATEIDVGGDVAPDDQFDLVIASRRSAIGERETGPLLYAGIDRAAARDLQLVKWGSRGAKASWIDAADMGPRPADSGAMVWPVAGRITSGFGYRMHPILGFARLHKGVDFGASWGSPIVAAADGRVSRAGWAGGYGRQVRIAHADGIGTSYSHMSSIVAEPGAYVRRGQLIGYVGSSGLSTGPHLHYEVYRWGQVVNPMSVRFVTGAPQIDGAEIAAFKARLKSLLSVGVKG